MVLYRLLKELKYSISLGPRRCAFVAMCCYLIQIILTVCVEWVPFRRNDSLILIETSITFECDHLHSYLYTNFQLIGACCFDDVEPSLFYEQRRWAGTGCFDFQLKIKLYTEYGVDVVTAERK